MIITDVYVPVDLCSLTVIECPYEETIEDKIAKAAIQYGVDVETSLRIAMCESSLNPLARNPTSSASGLYAFTVGTWEYIGSPGDRFNADDSIKAFMEWYPKFPSWWSCK